jgi:diketogulonate reductase-like aldo/keto reductase
MTTAMHTRPIPHSDERLPVVGCGTWRGFDVPRSNQGPLSEVLLALFESGGSVIDSSPMYGAAEGNVGDMLARLDARSSAFVASKVWTRGRAAGVRQMQQSMRLLRISRIDLMQVHNLIDWRTHLATLRDWQGEGLVRYLGVTHYTASAFDELEAVLASEPLDFVQLNYAVHDRVAEQRLLPLAQARGIGVIVNLPLGGGGLLGRLSAQALPACAAALECTSWPQLLLKWVLGHPAVTCVIPGTGRATHMRDNARAGCGPLPDAAQRREILTAMP